LTKVLLEAAALLANLERLEV